MRPFYAPLLIVLPPLAALCLCASFALAQTPVLPDQAPIPETRDEPAAGTGEDAPAQTPPSTDVPVPTPNPQADESPPAGEDKTPPAGEAGDAAQKPDATLPADAPVPEKRPKEPRKDDVAVPPEPPPEPADPRSAIIPATVMPADEKACRARLTELGVKFEEHAPRADPAGCSIPYPLVVKSLGKDIALEPEAEMNCAMAEAAARFSRDVISPAATKEFGEALKSVSHASAYVCRPRNGTHKLSEHAFGNAFDIASFTLSKKTRIEVILRPEEKPARFLGAVRRAACGPFKTVLGPGSDADHATHFHFDLARRRNGGTFCQ